MREPSLRETTKRWMALHLSIDVEGAYWIMDPKGAIRKPNLATFKVTTTYPFSCMIFSLCTSASVPIWHIEQLKTPQVIVYIRLIRDESNKLSPCRGPHPKVPSLGENLDDTISHSRTAMRSTFKTTNTTSVESILGSSTAPRSSRSAHSPALVPLAMFH